MIEPKNILKFARWVGWPLIAVYAVSMFLIPVIELRGDWGNIQRVWDRWQSLNVGMLALTSSLLAFSISKYNAEQKRVREFIAARAFLPHSLNEISSYCRQCMAVYLDVWNQIQAIDPENATRLNVSAPDLPQTHQSILQDCIRHASPHEGEYLSLLLRVLQVHQARMDDFLDSELSLLSKYSIFGKFCDLGEIYAIVDRLFPFSRGLKALDISDITLREIETAFALNHVEIEFMEGFREVINQRYGSATGASNGE